MWGVGEMNNDHFLDAAKMVLSRNYLICIVFVSVGQFGLY